MVTFENGQKNDPENRNCLHAKELWISTSFPFVPIGSHWFPLVPFRSVWFRFVPNGSHSFRFVPKLFPASVETSDGYVECYGLFLSFVRVVRSLN